MRWMPKNDTARSSPGEATTPTTSKTAGPRLVLKVSWLPMPIMGCALNSGAPSWDCDAGFWRNGFKFLKLFVPSGVPAYVLPIVVPIEIVSFLSRPISLSVRLFANILAGHITLKVFAGFIVTLGALGWLGWLGAILPLVMTIAITALEFLVAALQAYVFAVLTSMYINDAIHPSH